MEAYSYWNEVHKSFCQDKLFRSDHHNKIIIICYIEISVSTHFLLWGAIVIYSKKKFSAGILFNKEKQQATGEVLKT